jgi:hypothetical protein
VDHGADRVATAAPLAKGTAFLGVFKYLKSRPSGEEILKKVMATLAPEIRKHFERKVFAVADYPYPVFIAFLRQVDQTAGKGDLTLCRELGKFSAHLDIESVYNLYKKRAKPEDLSRDSSVIWKSYYTNAGTMKTEDISPEHTVVRIYDFPTMDPAHCRLMEGWMTQAMIEAGAMALTELREVKCPSSGGPYHEFIGSWRPLT